MMTSPARIDLPVMSFLRETAHDGADEIVLAHGIETRHLRGLAAEKRHLVLLARLAEAAHDLLELLGVDLRRAHVVHEEQRLGALNEDVVHAVVDDVLADGIVLAHHRGHLQLGAHAVGRGHENLVLAGGHAVKPAERTDVPDYAGRLGGRDHLLDRTNRLHLDVDVDAGCGIGGLLLRIFRHGLQFFRDWET